MWLTISAVTLAGAICLNLSALMQNSLAVFGPTGQADPQTALDGLGREGVETVLTSISPTDCVLAAPHETD